MSSLQTISDRDRYLQDATSVGLGCVYADIRDYNIDEATAENICKDFGEGGRLVEIIK